MDSKPVARKALLWLLAPLGILVITASYYLLVIGNARSHTDDHIAEAYTKWGSSVEVSDFKPERIDLLLAVEDPAFYQHRGVDFETPGAGMTTLSQSLVKLLYFPDGFKPGLAKIRQTLIARYALDALASKEEQLKLFLNIAYFGTENGQPIHGFDSASNVYFSKSHLKLTDQEFLSLVAMFISPNAMKPGTEENRLRMASIEKFLTGETVPASVMDVAYDGERGGSTAEELLIGFLRLITM